MNVIAVSIEQLEPNPWNPRRMTENQLSALRRSIRTDGFLQPIVARPLRRDGTPYLDDKWQQDTEVRWQILGGEQRYRALRAEEFEVAEVVPYPCDDGVARRITLSLNNEGNDDRELLDVLLASLVTDFDYNPGELADLTALSEDTIIAAVELGPSDDSLLGVAAGSGSEGPTEAEPVELRFTVSEEAAAEFMAALTKIAEHIGATGATSREPELLAMARLALSALETANAAVVSTVEE